MNSKHNKWTAQVHPKTWTQDIKLTCECGTAITGAMSPLEAMNSHRLDMLLGELEVKWLPPKLA